MDEPTAGLCKCGCGEPTSIASRARKTRGLVKGQPVRYVKGHGNRKRDIEVSEWASKAQFLAAHLDERLAERFWAKVSKDGPIVPHCPELGPCWIWTAAKDPKGYGYFSVGGAMVRRTFTAHRVAAALDGRVPADDQETCHHCDNPPCVRPDHLFIGTPSDNMRDMRAKGRGNSPWVVCSQGHSLTDEANVYVSVANGRTYRTCIACQRARNRAAYQARRKAGTA